MNGLCTAACWRVARRVRGGQFLSALAFVSIPLTDTACQPTIDTVFHRRTVSFVSARTQTTEASSDPEIELMLDSPAEEPVVVNVSVQGGEASADDDCDSRDFSINQEVEFAPGEVRAKLVLTQIDDAVPEIDETIELRLTSASGASLGELQDHVHVVLDDDRGALLDVVRDFGAAGDGQSDDTVAIQSAIDRAGASANAVVYFPAGDYVVTSLVLSSDANYVGPAAKLLQAEGQPQDAQMLRLEYAGTEPSRPVLVQGLTLSGRRDLQGPFEAWEFQRSALLTLQATDAPLRAVLMNLSLEDMGGNGVVLTRGTDAFVCHLVGTEVFTDFLKVLGGDIRLELRHAEGRGRVGTTGIAVTSTAASDSESKAVVAELEDVRLVTGDLEVDVEADSVVQIRQLIMEQPPLYLRAKNSRISVEQSRLFVGPSRYRFNRIVAPGQRTFSGVTFVLDELIDVSIDEPEMDRVWSALVVTLDDVSYGYDADQDDVFIESLSNQSVRSDGCSVERASSVEATDREFFASALTSEGTGNVLSVEAPTGLEALSGAFAEPCSGCALR